MKKLIVFLFALFTVSASAQTTLLTDGVTHNIAPGYISGDSIHTIGLIDMRDGVAKMDSFQVHINTEDSLRYTVYVVPVGAIGTWNVADSVGGCLPPAIATYYHQHTAEGISVVPFFRILAAVGQNAYFSPMRVYIRVWAVGSEVASSSKKFKTTIRVYK